jgi:outer membrane protein assembly factor BamD
MKRNFVYILFFAIGTVFIGTSCKSNFEKIRASGDTDLIYKTAFDLYEAEEYQRAQTLFELIIPQYRGKAELEKIYKAYAYTFYKQGKFVLSNYYFKNFATTFPNSESKEEAEFMAAYSNYEMSPSYRLDQTFTEQAIEDFQVFTNTYPNSERVSECNRLIDEMRLKQEEKVFEEGQLYFDLRQYQAATVTYENLLRDFPETTRGASVRYMMAKAAYNLAENSVYEKKSERYTIAANYAQDFLRKYKGNDNYSEIESIYDNSSKKAKSFPNG